MARNDNGRILQLRNEASLCLDDLAALVVNSSLFFELQRFSMEIMDLKPGFVFSLKQARALRDLTQKTLKQYQAHAISDGDLMNYLVDARTILKGKEQIYGGKKMGIINKVLHGKEIKKQESLNKLERNYKEVWEQILSCEDEMARCIEASRGCAPNSMIYRNNERAYNAAKDKVTLLRQQETKLNKVLDNTTRVRLMQDFNARQKEIERNTGIAIGNEKELDRTLAEASLHSERIDQTLEKVQNYGDVFLETKEETVTRPDSDFAAKVAADERRQAMMDAAGVDMAEVEAKLAERQDEFSKLVNARDTKD